MYLIFSHQLTKEQQMEARQRYGVTQFVPLPESLQRNWSSIPPEGDWNESWIKPIQDWLTWEAKPGSVVLVQGEYGTTVYMVGWLRKHGYRPIYATSKRMVEEIIKDDGSVETIRVFKHVQFRDYP
jgi:hypothetical protein